MSRRANILVLLALTIGIVYACFAVPFLSPLIPDSPEAPIARPDVPPISDLDEIRYRLLLLKPGMKAREVHQVFDELLADKLVQKTGNALIGVTSIYRIGPDLTLNLRTARDEGLSEAEIRNGDKVVARMPSETSLSAKEKERR
jgi:hypothetical protein